MYNCHVERSHRDIYSEVLCFLARTLSCLEDNELLDPLNELHLFALHYTFILESISAYRNLRASGKIIHYLLKKNLSPIQLNTAGMLENEHSGYAAVESVFDTCNRHDYRVDPSTPVPLEEDHQVVVPDTSLPLSDQQMAFLENHCNPLQENDKSGENIYLCT